MILRRAVFISLLTLALVASQPAYSQDIRVTASVLSRATTTAQFGKLPKIYASAKVRVCNMGTAPLVISLGYVEQAIQTPGFTLLPMDAAVEVIAAAQGNSLGSRLFRGGMTAVELAAIASSWSTLSSTIKNVLTSSAIAGASALTVLSSTIPTHTYLTLTNEALPDPLQLAVNGCSKSSIVIVEADPAIKILDFRTTIK